MIQTFVFIDHSLRLKRRSVWVQRLALDKRLLEILLLVHRHWLLLVELLLLLLLLHHHWLHWRLAGLLLDLNVDF